MPADLVFAEPATRAARSASRRTPNSERRGTSTSSSVRSREATWVSSRECPPRSKKSWSRPSADLSILSTFDQIRAIASSVAVVG